MEKQLIVILCVLCLHFLFINGTTDLCDADMPAIPFLSSRDPTVVITNKTAHWTFCDLYALQINQWYSSKNSMSTSCPEMLMCGTQFPIWMTGQNPEFHEGVVNRTACLRVDIYSCCLHTYNITVVNCGNFMGYCFVEHPEGCRQRYCFDVDKQSMSQHLTSVKTQQTTNIPEDRNDARITSSVANGQVSAIGTSGAVDTTSILQHQTDQTTHITEPKHRSSEGVVEKRLLIVLACLLAMAIGIFGVCICYKSPQARVKDYSWRDAKRF